MAERKGLSKRVEKSDPTVQICLNSRDFQQRSYSGHMILLINPYVYDIRYPWIKWNQPVGLLRIGTLLKKFGHKPKMLDCLKPDKRGIIKKRKVKEIKKDQYRLNLWNYGMQKHQFQNELKKIKEEPKEIWITCMVCYWWKSAHEIAQMCKEYFPRTHIVLGGSYPTFFIEHAKKHFEISKTCEGERVSDYIEHGFNEDTIVTGGIPEAFHEFPAFNLCKEPPKFAAINAINEEKEIFRRPNHVVSEIRHVIDIYGIRNFVFFDDDVLFNKGEYLDRILKILIRRNLKARFWGLHGIDPHEITENVIFKMKRAKFQMITLQHMFQRDRNLDFDCYREALRIIKQQGYRERDGAISCQYYIGRPGEDFEQVVEDILELHHIVGTVIPVPFLPVSGTQEFYEFKKMMNNNDLQLEDLNVNLFPCAESNGYSISDYFDLIRMTTMLNKKVRRRTFDFLGADDVAQALRKSISSHEEPMNTGEVSQE